MAQWSTKFKQRLRDGEVFAPQFRLVIGTAAISTNIGHWENESRKILEIATHPSTSSFADIVGPVGQGAFNGANYAFVVGLTDRINCGAQSVTPRKFAYTGMTLTCEVTPHAAELAMQMQIGTLSRLEVRFMDGSKTDGPTDFETIHIGQYQGLNWNGERYILSFGDALQAAEQRSTDQGGFKSAASTASYNWFEGVGTITRTTGTALLDFDNTTLGIDLTSSYDNRADDRLGHTEKKITSFGGQLFHYGHTIEGARLTNQWALIQNTSNELTYVCFNGLAVGSGGKMRLGGTDSVGVHGINSRREGGDVPGGMDIGSTVKSCVLLHGTPVTEIVNTIYTMGYNDQMVCGLFGDTVAEAKNSLNRDDLALAHNTFNDQYKGVTGALAGSRSHVPFLALITSPSQTGYSDIKKLAAKFGVFPRFKEGGYSVGLVTRQAYDRRTYGDHTTIQMRDIESVEWLQMHPQTRGSYAELNGVSSDHDDVDPPRVVSANQTEGAAPIIPLLEINNTDVAMGSNQGRRFHKYFEDVIYSHWFVPTHEQVTVRLCGLRFAHLAPGDQVDIFMGDSDMGIAEGFAYGPLREGGFSKHLVSSVPSPGSELGGLFSYFVLSVKVDWVGIKVHLTLSRRRVKPAGAFKNTIASTSSFDIFQATGLPQRDIDPDY